MSDIAAANPVDVEFEYIQAQNKTWRSLGLDTLMYRTREGKITIEDLSSDALDAIIDRSAFSASKMSGIGQSKILEGSIVNKTIVSQYRAYKAVVSSTGQGDFANIQSAVDSVNGLGGGIVLLRAGTYTITANINLYSNVHLVGEDQNTTILDFNSGAYQLACKGTSGSHKKNIKIENLQLKNCRIDSDGAIGFQYADDCSVRDSYFTGNYDSTDKNTYDILADNCTRLHVDNNQSINSFRLLTTTNSNYVWSNRNVITGNYGDIWNFGTGTNYVFVSDNYIGASNLIADEHACLYSSSTGQYLTIANNQFQDTGENNIYINGTGQAIVSGNFLVGSGYNLWLKDANRIVVLGNFFKVSQTHSLYLNNADCVTVVGNVFTDNNADFAVQVDSTCERVCIVGNTGYNNVGGTYNDDGGTDIINAHNCPTASW
jgi:hypothetical protein